MERNFFRRVEVAFPVLDKKLRERVIADLQGYLEDTGQTWLLRADGTYQRVTPAAGDKGIQQKLLDEALG